MLHKMKQSNDVAKWLLQEYTHKPLNVSVKCINNRIKSLSSTNNVFAINHDAIQYYKHVIKINRLTLNDYVKLRQTWQSMVTYNSNLHKRVLNVNNVSLSSTINWYRYKIRIYQNDLEQLKLYPNDILLDMFHPASHLDVWSWLRFISTPKQFKQFSTFIQNYASRKMQHLKLIKHNFLQ